MFFLLNARPAFIHELAQRQNVGKKNIVELQSSHDNETKNEWRKLHRWMLCTAADVVSWSELLQPEIARWNKPDLALAREGLLIGEMSEKALRLS